MSKIAIIGATSHIAKGLIYSFLNNTDDILFLFARNVTGVYGFLESYALISDKYQVFTFDEFKDNQYDVIINCIGIADPRKLRDAGSNIISLSETFDNMILDYLKNHEDTFYINFSSGAVYGTAFDKPVDYDSLAEIQINNISSNDYYRLAKLYSEAKHRSLKEFHIVDLRVFSYFSRFIDLKSSFLMTDIIRAIINETELLINEVDIVRDYIYPKDLFKLIKLVVKKSFNGVLDCYSAAPVRKYELLDTFNKEFGLRYQISKSAKVIETTGNKNVYYSMNRKAEEFGYKPEKDSIECLLYESKYLMRI